MDSTDIIPFRLKVVHFAAPALCVILSLLSTAGQDPRDDLSLTASASAITRASDNGGGALILLLGIIAYAVPLITGNNTVFGMLVLIYTALPKELFVYLLFFVTFLLFSMKAERAVADVCEQKQFLSIGPWQGLGDDDNAFTMTTDAPETCPNTPNTHSRCSSSESLVVVYTGETDAAADVGNAAWWEDKTAVVEDVEAEAIIIYAGIPEPTVPPVPIISSELLYAESESVAPDAPAIVPCAAAVAPSLPQAVTTYLTASGLDTSLLQLEDENNIGAFGDIRFVSTKQVDEGGAREYFAVKTCKESPGGRRQMAREIDVLTRVRQEKLPHVVEVLEIRVEPTPMILMRREPATLSSYLEECSNSDPRRVARVACDILSAVGDLSSMFGYIHRDIKPDNVLIDSHGNAKLTDFGMCVTAEDARLPENIGDGTPAYSAPETHTSEGATVLSEIYATAVIFIEGLMNNCPFGEKELLRAARDRLDDLEAQREDLIERIEIEQEEEENEDDDDDDDEDGEGAKASDVEKLSKDLELVRIKEHRLGVVSDDAWEPDSAAALKMKDMGEPLSFFRVHEDESAPTEEERGDAARRAAQGSPSKLFEDNWVEWLTTYSRAECDEGVRAAVGVVLDGRMLDPNPDLRPQTVQAARQVVLEALAVYEAAESSAKLQSG